MARLNITKDRIQALDPHDMLGKTLELPEQLAEGMNLGRSLVETRELPAPEVIDWYGLGGSAVAGDMLLALGFEPPAIPIRFVVRRYPYSPDTNVMRLICSYSGETVEALEAFREVKAGQIWLTMSSGGSLEREAKSVNVPHVKLPDEYPPRTALGFMLGAILAILEQALLGTRIELPLATLRSDAESYRNLDPKENRALALAVRLVNQTPIIYTVDGLGMPAVAGRFRSQLAENSKVWSHMAQLPEMAHNEVESVPFLAQVLPSPYVLLLGSWNLEAPIADPRAALTKLLIDHSLVVERIDPAEMWGSGLNRVESVLRTLLLLDSVSIYLALLNAEDPAEIPVITKLKKSSA